jgi:hypothetical protein
LGVGVEEMRKEDRAEEKTYDWLEGLFRRSVMRESGGDNLDAPGLKGGWRCLMDGGRLDTGVAKGSLSKELAVVGRVGCAWTNGTTLSKRSGMLSSDGCPAMYKVLSLCLVINCREGPSK